MRLTYHQQHTSDTAANCRRTGQQRPPSVVLRWSGTSWATTVQLQRVKSSDTGERTVERDRWGNFSVLGKPYRRIRSLVPYRDPKSKIWHGEKIRVITWRYKSEDYGAKNVLDSLEIKKIKRLSEEVAVMP